jgi:hypothetical protein
VRLDDLLLVSREPKLVKIDVEGAEAMALRGARALLRDARPVLYCEVGEEQNTEVTCILREAGYVLFDGDCRAAQRVPRDRCVFNTLAIPSTRAGRP